MGMLDFDSAVGIEIRDADIVLCGVSRGLQGYRLTHSGRIENFRNRDVSELREAIDAVFSTNGVNRDNVVLGIPRDQVVVKELELPLDVEENLRQVVQFQTDKLKPAEESETCFDYAVLDRKEKEKTLLLQLAMVPQKLLDDYLALFGELDLYPAAVRYSSLGLHQIFYLHREGFSKRPSLVVDVQPGGLQIVVVEGPRLCLSQRVEIPTSELTPEVIFRELEDFLSRSRFSDSEFERLYLTGSCAEEMLVPLQQALGSAEFLTGGLSLKSDLLPSQVEGLAGAIGLAVSGIRKSPVGRLNLLPESKRTAGQRASVVPTLVLAVVLLVIGVGLLTRDFFQQQLFLQTVQAKVTDLQPRVDEALRIQQETQLKEGELKELNELLKGRNRALLILRDLTERIPDDAYLQSLSITREKVNLTGFSDSASSLIAILSDSEFLESVESRYITRDRATSKDKFNFEAQIEDASSTQEEQR